MFRRIWMRWKKKLLWICGLCFLAWINLQIGVSLLSFLTSPRNNSVGEKCKEILAPVLKDVSSGLVNIQWCSKNAREAAGILNVRLDIPFIYVVTPTYARPLQKAELTRLSYTLKLVPNLHWIVVEDSTNRTALVNNLLKKSGLQHSHLFVATPNEYKLKVSDPNWLKPKGVLQRNLALTWLRENLHSWDVGVVYFADDDNTYDLELFEEMRYTRKVSVWPVGLVGGLYVERPIVSNGKVVDWNSVFKPGRPYPLDMAGFAVNLNLLLKNPNAKFTYEIPRGFQESHILKQLISIEELEPKAKNCTKVLVWHTRSEAPKLKNEKRLKVMSNHAIEV